VALARRPSRVRFVVAFLLLASLTLITLDASGNGNATLRSARRGATSVLTPVQQAIHDVLRPIGNFLTGAVDYGKVEAENVRLRNQLDQLRNAEAQSAFAQQQAQELLRSQNLPFVGGITQIPAQVIDVGSSNFASTVTVNKGSAAGVKVNEPVVAAGGLAGSVSAVTARTATITLLTDPTFVVGVRLAEGNTGSAAGQGPGDDLKVTVLPADAPTPIEKKGEILSTSGLAMENFPAGIPVGRISSVAVPAGETEPVISLHPLVNAAALQYVQILLWSPQ
jgi:rod shape-determining protein MreC